MVDSSNHFTEELLHLRALSFQPPGPATLALAVVLAVCAVVTMVAELAVLL